MKIHSLLFMFLLISCASTQSKSLKDHIMPNSEIIKPLDTSVLNKYSSIIVLGDSLSDTHNIKESTMGLAPSSRAGYYQGRFSNGPMWADYLESYSDIEIYNNAVGGAKITENSFLRPSVEKQLKDLAKDEGKIDKKSSLVIMWIGANDYISIDKNYLNKDNSINESKYNNFLAKNKNDVKNIILNIEKMGFNEIALVTVPRISSSPFADDKKELNYIYDKAVISHNQFLSELAKNQHFYLLNAFFINDKTSSNLKTYGFTRRGPTHMGSVFSLKENKEAKENAKFLDDLHPSTLMHYYYADQFLKDLKK